MAWDQGMGNCTIPDEKGGICGRQIQEGEAIGTIVLGGPRVGHKRCADAYHSRLQQQEREKRLDMVKRMDQGGPGGPLDYNSERDGIMGSIPLDRKPGDPLPDTAQAAVDYATSVAESLPAPEGGPDPSLLAGLAKAAGVGNIADVPLEATPDEAVALATGEESAPASPRSPVTENGAVDFDRPSLSRASAGFSPDLSVPIFAMRSPSPLPDVRAKDGWVELEFEPEAETIVTLDPDDAEDLVRILSANIQRAWRQRR